MSSLTIHLEIGHEASLRTKITPEGFTHDWEVYVRGVNNADIHQYVEKVVFHLHETFIKPKRVVKEPPYSLKTSGYAGFNLPIEIYLRNNQEPRKIKFNYDLQLQPNGPTLYKVQKEKYVFNSPSDEFRNKLLKGGAVVGGTSHDTSETRSNIDEKNQMTSKPKLSTSSLDALKKPKYRPDMNRDSFHNLFGTPITKTNKPEVVKPKEQSQSKSQPSVKPEKEKSKTKNPYKDKEKSKSSNDSKSKEERKSKEKPKEHDRSREKKREKSRDRSATPKEKERKEEKKSKKEKREHKENKHREREKSDHKESHKSRDVKPAKENHVVKEIKESSPFPQQKTDKKDKLKEDEKQQRVEEKSKHKYKKKDKERKEKKEEKSHKEKKPLIKENGKELPPDKSSLFDSPKSEEPKKPNALVEESSSSSRNSSRDPSPIPEPIEKKVHDNNVELKKIKDEMREKKKEKREKKRDKKLEKEHEKKRKRKLDSEMDVPLPPPPEKKERDDDFVNNNSDDERKVSSSEDATSLVPPKNENEDYMGMLRNLQHKIMALKDNNDLQKVVQLIAETGRYEVSQHTFDFDLCLLEPSTVRQLQDFFSTIP